VSEPLSPQLLGALLRALWAGHPSQRARVLKAISRLDDATLSAPPVTATFRRLLAGESDALTRGVGELVARRRLSVYAEDLVALLDRGRERREWAQLWLRRLPLGRGARAALLDAADDDSLSLDARRAALQAICPPRTPRAKTAAVDLDPEERARLLPILRVEALHADLLRILGDEIEEAFVEAAIEANRRWGEELYRRSRQSRGFLARLFPARPSSLGVWPGRGPAQTPFLLGIARLAAVAKDRRWLAAFHEYLHAPGFGPLLAKAYGEEVIREVAAPILSDASNFWGDERARVTVEVLGRLGEKRAAIRLRQLLPPAHARPEALGSAVIVALARLGDGPALEPHLKALLARLEHHLRGGKGVPTDLGDPCHPDAVGPLLEAATELEDSRFAFPAFGLLGHKTPFPAAGPGLPRLLARLQTAGVLGKEELALVSRLRVTLVPTDPKARPTEFAQATALETIRLARLVELTPAVATYARQTSHARLRDGAVGVLAELGRGQDADDLEAVLLEAPASDAASLKLWRALAELRPGDELAETAEGLLREGRGGRRTQEALLRFLGGELPPGRFLRLCLSLVRSPHGAVRTRALREAVSRGLFSRLSELDDELALDSAPAARAPQQDLVGDLLTTASEAFEALGHDPDARRQARVFLDALLPTSGIGPLDSDEATVLRSRLRNLAAWVEVPTFHAMHRELLELSALAGPPPQATGEGTRDEPHLELGLFQALVLRGLGSKLFPHPIRLKRQRYWGPLPRLESVWASPSPFVQVALFEVLTTPDYLLTDGLLVRLLSSPRASVRAGALAKLSRQACLVRDQAVLERVADPDPRVRRALVSLLRSHELARYAASLRALLLDPDEATRLLATRTLAEWGDPSCLEALTAFLDSDDDGLRAEAVATLRGFDPALLGGILARHVRIEAPRAAAAALAALRPDRLPSDPALGDAVFRVAALGSGPLRARALRFLPALAEPSRMAEVVPLLRDPAPSVRQAARDVLRRRDGRRQAPAVAEAAVAVKDPTQRLEILGLLADLGVPEAAGGLLPLLLDPSAEVRAATRRALQAGRAFSRAPELAKLLAEGIQSNAEPQVLAELVRFLDREAPLGGPEAIEWFADALRCEEPRVWRAALQAAWRRETTPEARAQSVVVDRIEACLQATVAPSSGVLGIALREVSRREVGQRQAIRKAVEGLAKAPQEGARPVLRRKALALLASWEFPEAEALAKTLSEDAAARAKDRFQALEAKAKQLKKDKPWYRGRVGTKSERVELSRARADVVGGERIRLSLAAGAAGSGFSERARKIPALVAKSRVLNAAIVAEVAERWRAEPSFDAVKATSALLGPNPDRQSWARAGVLAPPLRALALLRDRLEPEGWLARSGRLPGKIRDQLDTVAYLTALAHAPSLELAPFQSAITRAPGEDPQRAERARLESFLLSCMEHWRPELRALFPDLVAAGQIWHGTIRKDRWGHRDREGRNLAERYAAAQLRMNLEAAPDTLLELAGDDLLGRLILAALGRSESLAAGFESMAGTSKVDDRVALCGLLAEVGDAVAVAALAERVQDDAPRVRAAAAEAAWRVKPDAREPLVELLPVLLGDKEVRVRAAALRAVGRLGLEDRAAAVEAALIGDVNLADEAVQAACGAAAALGLSGQVGALLARVEGPPGVPHPEALGAIRALAGPKDASQIVARIAACEGQAARTRLAEVLEEVWERSGAPADAIGAALSLQLSGEPTRWPIVLRLLARAGFEPSAASLPDLMAHPEEAVRSAAVRAAASLGAERKAIDEALRAIYADEVQSSQLRGEALESLVKRSPRPAAWRLLATAHAGELGRPVLRILLDLGLPQESELSELLSETGWDPARWALKLFVASVAAGFMPPDAHETPLGLAQRLGFAGAEISPRVRSLTRAEAEASAQGRQWLAGELAVAGEPCRGPRRCSDLSLEVTRVLQLPGAEAERDLAELILLRVVAQRPQASLPCLALFKGPEREERLRDLLARVARPLRTAPELFEELAEFDPQAALQLLPADAPSRDPALYARLLARAHERDPEAWRGAVAELLLSRAPGVRWQARVALEPDRSPPTSKERS